MGEPDRISIKDSPIAPWFIGGILIKCSLLQRNLGGTISMSTELVPSGIASTNAIFWTLVLKVENTPRQKKVQTHKTPHP